MRHLGRFDTFALSLLAVAGLLASPAAAAPPPADSAGASPRLKYLPKDYWLVAELDCATAMEFMNSEAARKNPQHAQFKQSMLLVKAMTGVDAEKEVDWITLFAAGSPGDRTRVLAVAQGSFDNDAVARRLTLNFAGSIAEKAHKRRKIYVFPGAALFFPEASTAVVGDEGLVRAAIDQLASGPRDVPAALKGVLDRTPGKSVVWAAVQPRVVLEHKELADWRAGNADLYKALKKVEALSLSFEVKEDGLVIKGLGHAAGPGEAKNVYKYLSDRKKNLLHEEGANALFISLLILSEIKTSGPYIEGSFRLTGQAFKELWESKLVVRPGSTGRKEK
jgi:hypothetical protein